MGNQILVVGPSMLEVTYRIDGIRQSPSDER